MREIDALVEVRSGRDRIEDTRMAQIAHILYHANKSANGPDLTIEDFMPTVPKRGPREQSYEEIRALTETINQKLYNQ